MKFNKILVVPLILGLAGITWCVKEVAYAKKQVGSNNMPPNVTCYKPMAAPTAPDFSAEELQQSMDDLESMYNKGQINKETYEQRKKDLQNKLDNLESK